MKTLKELREQKGVKQVAIAEHLGIARQTYSNYEQNPEKLSVPQAEAICKFLGYDFKEVSDIFLNKDVC